MTLSTWMTTTLLSRHSGAGGRTLRFLGFVGSHELRILVDSGATHNFIDYTRANDMLLPLRRAHLPVTLASGAQVLSRGVCCSLQLSIRSASFVLDVYTAELPDNVDIVLGTLWLASLGPIMMDFSTLSMSFFVDGVHTLMVGQDSTLHPQTSLPAPASQETPSASQDTSSALTLACMGTTGGIRDVLHFLLG